MNLLAPSVVFVVGVCLFVLLWYRDSRATLIFTPFFVFSVNDITRNWIAGYAAPLLRTTPDFYAFYLFVGAYAVFAITYVVTSSAMQHSPSLAHMFRDAPVQRGHDRAQLVTIIAALIGIGGLSLYQFHGIPVAALTAFDFLRGTADEKAAVALGAARNVLTKGHIFGGVEYAGQGIITTVIRGGWALLVAVTYLRWREVKTRGAAIMFGATFFVALIFVGGDGTRGYVLWTMIFALVVVSLVRPVPLSYAFGVVAALVLLAIGLSVISPKLHWALQRDDFWFIAIKAIADRAFLANGTNTVEIIDLVRDHVWDMRLGSAHIKKFLAALPGTPSGPPVAYELYKTLNPLAHGTTFSSATYISEAYLDFGVWGALTGYAIAGMVIAVVQRMLLATRKGMFALPLVAYVILTVGRFPLVGPVAIITTLVMAALICLALWFVYSMALTLGTPRPALSAGTDGVPTT